MLQATVDLGGLTISLDRKKVSFFFIIIIYSASKAVDFCGKTAVYQLVSKSCKPL